MSLRAIHDFELALVAPCIAMLERGVRVDEPRRVSMIKVLDALRTPLEAEAKRRAEWEESVEKRLQEVRHAAGFDRSPPPTAAPAGEKS